MQAVSEEENGNSEHALTLYTDAAEICLEKVINSWWPLIL